MARKFGARQDSESWHHITEGAELEISLLGDNPADKFDPNRRHGDHTEEELRVKGCRGDLEAVKTAIQLVKGQTDRAEKSGNPDWSDITIEPITSYSSELYKEFCRLAGFEDFDSGGIRFYNALYTLLDKMGADFFLDVDPKFLPPEKFGDLRMLREPVTITGDVTKNPEKTSYKADKVLQYEAIPESHEEITKSAKLDALRMMKALIGVVSNALGTSYNPPIDKELDEMMAPKTVERKERGEVIPHISGHVVRRVRKVSKESSQ